jgi:hypothetical protein
VSLTLAGWILGAIAVLLVGSLRWADRIAARAEGLELARSVWVILEEELRPGLPDRDWRLTSERSLELRAFRGLGRVCGAADGRWEVAFRGLRVPDPARDSVLILGADGGWRAAELTGSWAGGDACEPDPGEALRRLAWSPQGEIPPVLVRVFERGRYSLEDGAFRYLRGAGGRQPLTPERVGPQSRFEVEGTGFRVLLEVEGWHPGSPVTTFGWTVTPGEARAW